MNTSQFTLAACRVLSSHMWLVTAMWPMWVCKMPPYSHPHAHVPLAHDTHIRVGHDFTRLCASEGGGCVLFILGHPVAPQPVTEMGLRRCGL